MTELRIGFIGLGLMGSRLASRLIPVGDLSVYDVDAAKVAAFAGHARTASTITEVAEGADVVSICVQNDAQVTECAEAVLPVMPPGSVLVIHSTVSPQTVKAAGRIASARGVDVVDAGVTVTERDVFREQPFGGDPFVLLMLGGEDAAIERIRPLLDALAVETVRCTTLGSAMALKIINNLVTHVETIVAEEAFRVATLSDVPPEALRTVMERNGVLAASMVKITSRIGEPPADLPEQRIREVMATNGVKDLTLVEELAKEAVTACATARFAKDQYWFATMARGLPSA